MQLNENVFKFLLCEIKSYISLEVCVLSGNGCYFGPCRQGVTSIPVKISVFFLMG